MFAGMKKRDADLSTSIQNCARLEQNFIAVQNCGIDPDTFQCTRNMPASSTSYNVSRRDNCK